MTQQRLAGPVLILMTLVVALLSLSTLGGCCQEGVDCTESEYQASKNK